MIGAATGLGRERSEGCDLSECRAAEGRWQDGSYTDIPDDVPVDGFWSISVYGADGYFHKNDQNAYSINNVTAKNAADGSVRIQSGGCDGQTSNCIPITAGWNYRVRLYRPRKEALEGRYKFPEAVPVE